MRDLDMRATLIANTVREPIESSQRSGDDARVLQLLTRITEDERVYAAAFCPSTGGSPLFAGTLPDAVRCDDLESFTSAPGHVLTSPHGPLLMSVRAIRTDGAEGGELVLIHDMSVVRSTADKARRI